ncbi:MAG: YfhO family protein [Patescibacteria group bacterium]|nr:YfhO family protein [Patescibacteria group bacterium]MCL5431532.1 YfhO family protein [Patescibacteria group bacterium]
MPLWDPYIFSGLPALANYQTAVFYPFNILYFFLPQITAWSALVLVQPLLATWFAYLYFRSLKLSSLASFLASFSFGFSGFIISWTQAAAVVSQTAIWLPLLLYFLEKRSYRWLALFLAVCFFAGYFQVTFYIVALLAVYALVRSRLTGFLLALAFSFLIAAVQIIPTAQALSLSPRLSSEIEKVFATYLLAPTHLLRLLSPDINGNPATWNYAGPGSYEETALYLGLVPLAFALFAILRRKPTFLPKFFLGAAIISFALTSNFFLTRWFLHLPLPFIPTFQPSRILILTTFSLSALAAFGFDRWLKNNDRRRLIKIFLSFIPLLLAAGIFAHSPVSWRNLVLPLAMAAAAVALLFLNRRRLTIFGLVGITLLGQVYFFNKYLSIGYPQLLYPASPVFEFLQNHNDLSRFLTFGEAVKQNLSLQTQTYSPEGFDPIYPLRYGQLAYAASFNGQLETQKISRTEITLSEMGSTESAKTKPRLLRLWALLGVKYFLYYPKPDVPRPAQDIFLPDLFTPVASFSGWSAFEFKNVLPRVFLADRVTVATDPQTQLDTIFADDFNLRRDLVLEEVPAQLPVAGTDPGQAIITQYEPARVTIKTQADGPRFLFLSDNFYPGWQATLDGQQTKIYRADFSFRAVYVPAGDHVVVFNYQPESFAIGLRLSVLGLLVFATLLFFGGRRKAKSPELSSP